MTDEHFRIVTFIDAYAREHGHPPTYAEIARAVGLSSAGQVQYRVAKLEAAGYLARTPRRARSLRVVRMPPVKRGRTAAPAPWCRTVRAAARLFAVRIGDGLNRVWLWLRALASPVSDRPLAA